MISSLRSALLGVVGSVLAVGTTQLALGVPALHPSVAGQFEVTLFADGLNFPTSMQRLSDGSLLVATNDSARGSLFASTGSLLRFVDADDDGVADGPGQVVLPSLPGAITSVRSAGPFVFVSSLIGRRIDVLRSGASPGEALTSLGTIDFTFAPPWEHASTALAVRQDPNDASAFELFFSIGSRANATRTLTPVPVSGLVSGTLAADSIYRVHVADSAGTPVFSALEQVASGLRNAAGMVFDPDTGDLLFVDNSIDGLVDVNEPLSADELNRIVAMDLGGAVEDFGFAERYVTYRTGGQGGAGDDPLVAFQPLPDPANGSESEGPNEIAFVPDAFRASLGRGVFVGFHGKFTAGGLANEENPLVFYSLDSDSYFHFIENDQADVGHLDGLLATDRDLFVADLSTVGALTGAAREGAIYRIRARVPAPASPLGAALVFGVLAVGLRLRRRPALLRAGPTRS